MHLTFNITATGWTQEESSTVFGKPWGAAPSQVMVDWPQTIQLAQIGDIIGALDTTTMQAITRQLAVVLGIGTLPGRHAVQNS